MLVTLGETCSLRKSKSSLAGQPTLVAAAPSHRVGKVVFVSKPGPATDSRLDAGIPVGTRQLAQASPGYRPLLTSLSTDGVPLASHKLPRPAWQPGRRYMARPTCTIFHHPCTSPATTELVGLTDRPCEPCQSVPRAAVSSELVSILTSVAWWNSNISPHCTLSEQQH